MSNLSSDITTAAGEAKRLKHGDKEKESRSLSELIEADRYLSDQGNVTASNRRGLVLTKLRPGGGI